MVFPCDKGTDKKTTVTATELNVRNNATVSYDVSLLPEGDLDVRLIVVAYFKRFGSGIKTNGAYLQDVPNNFYGGGKKIFEDNANLEPSDIKDLGENYTLAVLSKDEISGKGIVFPYLLPDGRSVTYHWYYGLRVSDGTCVSLYHAFCWHGYDAQTDEFILTGEERTSAARLRLPSAMAIFFRGTKRVQPK